MPTIQYEGNSYNVFDGETVLDCLIRNGEKITHSCRSGVCHSCILKTKSNICSISQKGLNKAKIESGLFLSCQQPADKDLEVFKPDTSMLLTQATVISQDRISDTVAIVKIKTDDIFAFKAGQFINLIRHDGVCRSYSIASQTGSDTIELHIRKITDGKMSAWLYEEDLIGEKIQVSEALGECYLTDDMADKNLLLIGVGTGLAPLYGVLQDCIKNKSFQSVTLFQGSLNFEGLYLVESLKNIESNHDFFSYIPVYLRGEKRHGFEVGNLVEIIRDHKYCSSNTIVMICGDPFLVKELKQTVFMSGVPSKNILSDPFVTQNKAT